MTVLVSFGMAATVQAASTVALLAPLEDQPATNIVALLNVALSGKAGVSMVERQQLDQVLHEQELANCMNDSGVAQRLKLGRLLRADLLVFVKSFDKPVPHLQVVVSETRQGLRLLVDVAALTSDPDTDARTVGQKLDAAIVRSTQPIRQIVAVPPLACEDLHSDFEGLGPAFALLIEQALLKSNGVVVVQLAEAQAIGREMAIAGQLNINRPLPVVVLGKYRNDGTGDQRQMSFALTLQRSGTELKNVSQGKIKPEDAPSAVVKLSNSLLEGKLVGAPAMPDADADATQLASRGSALALYGQFDDALQLFEASLLLRDRPDVHEKAAHVIIAEWGTVAYGAGGPQSEPERETIAKQRMPHLLVGLRHCEEFMKKTKLDHLHEFTARSYIQGSLLPPDAVRSMILRVMKAKYETGTRDDILKYVLDFLPSSQPAPLDNYSWVDDLAAYIVPGTDPALLTYIVNGVRAGNPDDFRKAPDRMRLAIERMSALDNAVAREAAATMTRRLNAGLSVISDQPITPLKVVPLVPDSNPDIRIELLAEGYKGIMPVGKGIDILWNDDLFLMKELGKVTAVGHIVDNACPCFDGRYIWTMSNVAGEAVLTALDPATLRYWTAGSARGIPSAAINHFAAAPWEPGRVCVAASFGPLTNERSWIATASLSMETGISFHIVQEGRLRHEAGAYTRDISANDRDPAVAFQPWGAAQLCRSTVEGGPPITTVVIGEPTRWFDVSETKAGTSVSYNAGFHSLGFPDPIPAVQNGVWYWIAGPQLRCSRAGAMDCEVVNTTVPPYSPLCFAGRRAYAFSSDNKSLAIWTTDDITHPFHRLRTGWSKESIPDERVPDHFSGRFYLSNYYGLVLARDYGPLYQLFDKDGKPLPCR
jgi:hypothetical protein